MNQAMRQKEQAMSNSKYVPPEFVKDFELVASYYQFKQSGEYEEAKLLAKSDLENAIPCYKIMADYVREWTA
jgi:hypothetical protein